MRSLSILLVAATASADPRPLAFVEAEAAFGLAEVSTGTSTQTMGLFGVGIGAGAFVVPSVAVVARAHASYEQENPMLLAGFVGFGLHLRLAPLSQPADYAFFEVVPGYGGVGTPIEAGGSHGLAVSVRAGVELSHLSLAIGTTHLVHPQGTDQWDATLTAGLHFGWLSD